MGPGEERLSEEWVDNFKCLWLFKSPPFLSWCCVDMFTMACSEMQEQKQRWFKILKTDKGKIDLIRCPGLVVQGNRANNITVDG
jgi:hypothetical protein